MAEKDPPSRLRRAVKENNLFLVKRLVQRTDMRNPDPAPRRLTSLAWAALLGHEETFEFLLVSGHDDRELSRDSENNTILMILADCGPPPKTYGSSVSTLDFNSAALRMARLYYDRYQTTHKDLLDWSNGQGRTALHLSAVKGNEDLVRMFCDLNADINLSDNQGNTPLHYASAWGHVSIVQLLIERGCNYNSRNNQGFVASDYAYSFSTQEMQKTAEKQYEVTKKSRRVAVQNGRPVDFGLSTPINIPPGVRDAGPRMRSGSGTSRTTTTSDSGDVDGPSQTPRTTSSSPSQPSTTGSGSFFYSPKSSGHNPQMPSTSSLATFSGPTAAGKTSSSTINSVLSPITSRIREQDANARKNYMQRNRSESSSTDTRSQTGATYSSGLTVHNETITDLPPTGAITPRRLRPSASAAQLRHTHDHPSHAENRSRAGTNPSANPTPSPLPQLTRSSSTSNSVRTSSPSAGASEDPTAYHGPPSQYAKFPEPPPAQEDSTTPTTSRRKAFQILSKPSHALDHSSNHRRGMSATATRVTKSQGYKSGEAECGMLERHDVFPPTHNVHHVPMIPPIPDSDPDPTTQIAWPSSRARGTNGSDVGSNNGPESNTTPGSDGEDTTNIQLAPGKRKLSTWDLITLSISMAGAQIAWTVELGYGTPFLLSLGLSEQLTALVWLAGPISGLVAQPVIGAVSDSSTSKYRRRFWIILSTAALVISTLTLAYCVPLAEFWVDLFNVGSGDWDETRKEKANDVAILFAVISFYVLDFALNGLQASLRNLLLDIAPPNQLNAGNAWHSRMTNAGNIIGYGFGFLPLAELPIIRLVKGSQFRKFCIICILILVITVAITCVCHEEVERPSKAQNSSNGFREIMNNIRDAAFKLPKSIRRVCYVQLFAFMGWFPFLFYSTTYIGQVMAAEMNREPDPELATRRGNFAMLLYSVVGVIAGTILPHLANRDRRLLGRKTDVDDDAETSRLRETVRQWKVDAARQGKPLKLPAVPFLLRNIWSGAMLLYAFLTFSTFFVKTVTQATIFISLVGICWAVAINRNEQLLKEPVTPAQGEAAANRRPLRNRNISTPAVSRNNGERAPLLRRRSFHDSDPEPEEVVAPPTTLAGGTVLGIHNLAIVAPQFIVAIVNSIIFRIVDESANITSGGGGGSTYYGKTGVGWVLRFGGLCAFFGAFVARMVPLTPTEREMRRRLGEMHLLGEEPAP
ncbi:hypothetical protein NP233_g8982 [Leucocoprinus birnbaumii]|uniref:Uncharacterized protein n=1 Tax=Leucocoprinus birnbaumii TaxID=56174 RepID=A0AAD5YMM4_9AGAR|nr:hypothetical protein NP233_g8982 [Leucocoprinus birnbaumii]